ncbi:MAG: competence/damage-inducible protein A [Proteobacteria bacterium]|nr:competence/damage-inducible protein A [Pseudomonadota bacterium]
MAPTAAALIVGDEILSGKVRERNLSRLAGELFALGIRLRRAVVSPDVQEEIAADICALCGRYDYVFTSGGVGPTHDDLTLPAVAQALNRPLILHEELAQHVRTIYGARCNPNHMRMAHVPQGTTLVFGPKLRWPVIALGSLFVLPGVPEIFSMKLDALKIHLRQPHGFITRAVYALCDEGEVADCMQQLAQSHPDVAIGSYVKWQAKDYNLKVTFDGTDPIAVSRVLARFVKNLPAGSLVRVED